MHSVAVTEQSQVSEARREALGVARNAGLAEHDAERVALVATELATNLVRHAVDGELLVSLPASGGVQVMSIDAGPGMHDPELCRRDGFSTAGGSGTGLGAVGRIADHLDLYSLPGAGTAIVAQVLPRSATRTAPAAGLGWEAVVQAKPGQEACGDGCSVRLDGAGIVSFLMSDGIGHGPLAADAAQQSIRTFQRTAGEPPGRSMQAIHTALAGTRGSASAIARIDLAARELTYCGIGNIACSIFHGGSSRRAVSQSGTLGHSVRRVQEFVYPFPDGAVLMMHSDGLTSSWDLGGHAGLERHEPATIAGFLHKRHRRGRDDAAILVAKAP